MRERKTQGRKRLTGSTLAKIVAYFLLAISFLIGGVAAVATLYMAAQDVYTYRDRERSLANWVEDRLYTQAGNDIRSFYFRTWPEEQEELEQLLNDFCSAKNIEIEVYKTYVDEDGRREKILSNYRGLETPYVYSRFFTEYEEVEVQEEQPEKPEQSAPVPDTDSNAGVEVTPVPESGAILLETKIERREVQYEICLYVRQDFLMEDEYRLLYQQAAEVWSYRYEFPVIALIGILLCIISFLFLMCGAGHKNGREGITPGVLASIHIDVLTVGFGGVAFLILLFGVEIARGWNDLISLMWMVIIGAIEAVWCTIYCAELASRMKQGAWWKHSVIYAILCQVGRIIRFLWNAMIAVVKGLPLIVNTALIFLGISIAEFMGLYIFDAYDELIFAWFFEKLIVGPIILYIALVCKKLQEGSKSLAEGNLSYQIDTSKMLLDFKEHGENLNQIGQGISKAVDARMKSEHLKTELITNVSHDIKTPLTSIINYADLLGNAANAEAPLEQEKVAEYSEVLLRQSKRLKKLLEDLVEASKATTGNLDVKMERCEVGVLLSQAVGEYEPRFWEKQLELIVKQPEETVWIMADGRRLWRVFDNLLNNVCKYAQENTRVYLTVEPKERQVEIIFRNMSKYALEISGEELEERFVRGDKSRHMEGNGLGLSIAKSLVELQNGSMEIVTDGDLFKVILRFPML